MKTVHEVSRLSGVSVRTLHHYDAVGLLHPTALTESGYRLYDDTALRRLQSILLLRELEFPLKDIRRILEAPDFDRQRALEEQIRLLELRREQIDRLIALAREIQEQGENTMDFKAFDKKEIERYAAEAKQRWGATEAYRESEKRQQSRSAAQNDAVAAGMMEIFERFGAIRTGDSASDEAKALAAELRQYITEHYYPCTKEIFSGLGTMYAEDGRFRESIDAAGGTGTAAFAAAAIAAYCE